MHVTKAEFARLKGWNRSTATRYADAGKLVMTAQGLVDVEASEQRLAALADATKDGVRRRHERERALRGIHAADAAGDRPGDRFSTPPAGADRFGSLPDATQRNPETPRHGDRGPGWEKPDPADTSYLQLQKHRAESEAHRSALLRLEREQKEGRLVDAETVRKLAFEAARLVRNRLMGIRHTIDPELAGEPDPAKRAEVWDKHMRAICDEFARKVDAEQS